MIEIILAKDTLTDNSVVWTLIVKDPKIDDDLHIDLDPCSQSEAWEKAYMLLDTLNRCSHGCAELSQDIKEFVAGWSK